MLCYVNFTSVGKQKQNNPEGCCEDSVSPVHLFLSYVGKHETSFIPVIALTLLGLDPFTGLGQQLNFIPKSLSHYALYNFNTDIPWKYCGFGSRPL